MSNFIWKESKFREVPTFLTSTAEGFRDSPEYEQLADYELDIPGWLSVLLRDTCVGSMNKSKLAA
jgi:hypothetical protein